MGGRNWAKSLIAGDLKQTRESKNYERDLATLKI
jgi:hypothetical protein